MYTTKIQNQNTVYKDPYVIISGEFEPHWQVRFRIDSSCRIEEIRMHTCSELVIIILLLRTLFLPLRSVIIRKREEAYFFFSFMAVSLFIFFIGVTVKQDLSIVRIHAGVVPLTVIVVIALRIFAEETLQAFSISSCVCGNPILDSGAKQVSQASVVPGIVRLPILILENRVSRRIKCLLNDPLVGHFVIDLRIVVLIPLSGKLVGFRDVCAI